MKLYNGADCKSLRRMVETELRSIDKNISKTSKASLLYFLKTGSNSINSIDILLSIFGDPRSPKKKEDERKRKLYFTHKEDKCFLVQLFKSPNTFANAKNYYFLMEYLSPVKRRVRIYLLSSEEIIDKMCFLNHDKNKPLILNTNFPGTGIRSNTDGYIIALLHSKPIKVITYNIR